MSTLVSCLGLCVAVTSTRASYKTRQRGCVLAGAARIDSRRDLVPDHSSRPINTVNDLGNLYRDQGEASGGRQIIWENIAKLEPGLITANERKSELPF